MMGIIDNLGKQPQPMQMNPMQMLQQIKQNPAAVLKQAGINIPGDMRDPSQIIGYVLQTKQRPSNLYQQILSRIGWR